MTEATPAVQPSSEAPLAPTEVPEGASPLEVAGQAWLERRFIPPDNPFARAQGKRSEYSDAIDTYTARINAAKEHGITDEAIQQEAIRQASAAAKEAYAASQDVNTAINQELAQSGKNRFSIPRNDPRRVQLEKLQTTINRARQLGIADEIIQSKNDDQSTS